MPNGNITSYTIRYVTDSNGRSVDVPYNGDQVNTSILCLCDYVAIATAIYHIAGKFGG